MPLDIEKTKMLMKRHDINQKELAMMSGVTEAAMSRYLSGSRQPRSETLANMATALHTSSADLLGKDVTSEPEKIYGLVARNAHVMSKELRLRLINLLSHELESEDDRK